MEIRRDFLDPDNRNIRGEIGIGTIPDIFQRKITPDIKMGYLTTSMNPGISTAGCCNPAPLPQSTSGLPALSLPG